MGRNASDRKPQPAGKIVVANTVGPVLDPDISAADPRTMGSAERVVPFPCGVLLFLSREGGVVRARAPRHISESTCPQLTLAALADVVEDLQNRLAQLEELVLVDDGQGPLAAHERADFHVVRHQVHNEDAQANLLDDSAPSPTA